jgi:hypothetical protein
LIVAALKLPVLALEAGHLTDLEADLALIAQRKHLVDAVGSRAELGTAVHQRHRFRNRLQVERPVECRIAAADNQQVACRGTLPCGGPSRYTLLALIGLDARHRRPFRLERAAPAAITTACAMEQFALVGFHFEAAIVELAETGQPSG